MHHHPLSAWLQGPTPSGGGLEGLQPGSVGGRTSWAVYVVGQRAGVGCSLCWHSTHGTRGAPPLNMTPGPTHPSEPLCSSDPSCPSQSIGSPCAAPGQMLPPARSHNGMPFSCGLGSGVACSIWHGECGVRARPCSLPRESIRRLVPAKIPQRPTCCTHCMPHVLHMSHMATHAPQPHLHPPHVALAPTCDTPPHTTSNTCSNTPFPCLMHGSHTSHMPQMLHRCLPPHTMLLDAYACPRCLMPSQCSAAYHPNVPPCLPSSSIQAATATVQPPPYI